MKLTKEQQETAIKWAFSQMEKEESEKLRLKKKSILDGEIGKELKNKKPDIEKIRKLQKDFEKNYE